MNFSIWEGEKRKLPLKCLSKGPRRGSQQLPHHLMRHCRWQCDRHLEESPQTLCPYALWRRKILASKTSNEDVGVHLEHSSGALLLRGGGKSPRTTCVLMLLDILPWLAAVVLTFHLHITLGNERTKVSCTSPPISFFLSFFHPLIMPQMHLVFRPATPWSIPHPFSHQHFCWIRQQEKWHPHLTYEDKALRYQHRILTITENLEIKFLGIANYTPSMNMIRHKENKLADDVAFLHILRSSKTPKTQFEKRLECQNRSNDNKIVR